MVVFKDELENVLKNMNGDCGVIEFEQRGVIRTSEYTQIIRSKDMELIGW